MHNIDISANMAQVDMKLEEGLTVSGGIFYQQPSRQQK